MKGWREVELRKIVAAFVATYQKDGYAPYQIEYQQQGENLYRLVFPQDIHPTLFIFLVNFLAYPFEFDLKNRLITVCGKTKLDTTFAGLDRSLIGQQALLYIPDKDRDFTVVYLRTESGSHYYISFDRLVWEKSQDGRLSEDTQKLIIDSGF